MKFSVCNHQATKSPPYQQRLAIDADCFCIKYNRHFPPQTHTAKLFA